MRIRGTKPEFWRSERIASVDWDARLVLKGLESYVDDNGVGKDDLALIVGDLFQRDLVREPSRTLARVTEAISDLHNAGLLWRYEVDGTNLLYVSFWESVQRVDKPQAGRFPRPDGTFNYKDSIIRESSRALANVPDILAPVTGEQGNRGTGEQLQTPVPTAREIESSFDDAYSHWPKKVERKEALDRFRRASKKVGLVTLTESVIRFGDAYTTTTEKRFVPALGVWLNGERWTDDLPARDGPRRMTRTEENLAVVAQYAAMESQQGEINA